MIKKAKHYFHKTRHYITRVAKRRRFKILMALLAAGLIALASASYGVSRAPSININKIDAFRDFTEQDRILIIAPHCDDETLGAAGVIIKAVDKKIPVKVVMMTNGDNNIFSTDMQYKTLYPSAKKYIEAGEARQKETETALKSLGLTDSDIIFLSYPDGGVEKLYMTNWPTHNPYKSSATHETKSPYALTYNPKSIYAGEDVLRDLRHIISDFSPTIVITAHSQDQHPDHKYTFSFSQKALADAYGPETDQSAKPILLSYLVHHRYFPLPGGLQPENYLRPPFSSSLSFSWFKVMLTTDEEEKKYDAIRLYKSQIKVPELGPLMRGFVRKNELFEQVSY